MIAPQGQDKNTVKTTASVRKAWPSLRFGLAGALLFILAFLLGLILFLPASTVTERLLHEIERQSGIEFTAGSSRLIPPATLEIEDLEVPETGLPFGPLIIDRLTIDPSWLSLLSGDPAIDWQAELLAGELAGRVHSDGALAVNGGGLQFNFPLMEGSNLAVSGRLADLDLVGAAPLQKTTQSRIDLLLEEVVLIGLTGAGDNSGIRLGRIALNATGEGHTLRITQLNADDGDLTVAGEGSLLVTANPLNSRLALTLTLKPSPQAPDEVSTLLGLAGKPRADGSYQLKLTGPLSRLTFKP